jgi:hypothetical protein
VTKSSRVSKTHRIESPRETGTASSSARGELSKILDATNLVKVNTSGISRKARRRPNKGWGEVSPCETSFFLRDRVGSQILVRPCRRPMLQLFMLQLFMGSRINSDVHGGATSFSGSQHGDCRKPSGESERCQSDILQFPGRNRGSSLYCVERFLARYCELLYQRRLPARFVLVGNFCKRKSKRNRRSISPNRWHVANQIAKRLH